MLFANTLPSCIGIDFLNLKIELKHIRLLYLKILIFLSSVAGTTYSQNELAQNETNADKEEVNHEEYEPSALVEADAYRIEAIFFSRATGFSVALVPFAAMLDHPPVMVGCLLAFTSANLAAALVTARAAGGL